jgi:hypothetical protein
VDDPAEPGAKRPRRSVAPSPARLLARFEAGGRALQGKLMHAMVARLTENVTEAPAPGDAVPAPVVRLSFGHVELLLRPLSDLPAAAGAEQLRLVVGRMMEALPPRPETGPASPAAQAPPLPPVAAASLLGVRTAHWQDFVRGAAELAAQLRRGEPPRSGAAGAGGGVAALAESLSAAMAPSLTSAADAATADAGAAEAERAYVQQAVRVLSEDL